MRAECARDLEEERANRAEHERQRLHRQTLDIWLARAAEAAATERAEAAATERADAAGRADAAVLDADERQEAERNPAELVARDILVSLKKIDNPGGEKCSICFATDDNGVDADHLDTAMLGWRELACGHIFHANCIYGWMSRVSDPTQVPTCPICREEIKGPARP